ncbi:MAG: type II toxin-antitoxin system RelE/ParE family toxin [Rhodospirillales bacterium]
MTYRVTFSADAERDFELVFEFILESYIDFGETAATAIDRAEERVQAIHADIEGLASAPHRGTLHDGILPGLRHVTLGRAIVWFDILEENNEVRILAVFFGGQDHIRRMLVRMLG